MNIVAYAQYKHAITDWIGFMNKHQSPGVHILLSKGCPCKQILIRFGGVRGLIAQPQLSVGRRCNQCIKEIGCRAVHVFGFEPHTRGAVCVGEKLGGCQHGNPAIESRIQPAQIFVQIRHAVAIGIAGGIGEALFVKPVLVFPPVGDAVAIAVFGNKGEF